MQKKYLALSVAVVTLLSASCATLFTGTSQDIKFTSEPEGAENSRGRHQHGNHPGDRQSQETRHAQRS